jgi:hypothetical protein
LLESYFNARLEELILECALAVLEGASAQAATLGQEMMPARRNLSGFLTLFPADPPRDTRPPASPGFGELFPFGARNLDDAVAALLETLPDALPRLVDHVFQAEVLDTTGGLWELLATARDDQVPPVRLRDELMARARSQVGEFLGGVDVASLFLEWYASPEEFQEGLREQAQAAQPLAPVAPLWEHTVLVVPDSLAGAALQQKAVDVFAGLPLTVLETGDALLVLREAALHPSHMAALLAGDDSGIAGLAQKLLTRSDVNWTAF